VDAIPGLLMSGDAAPTAAEMLEEPMSDAKKKKLQRMLKVPDVYFSTSLSAFCCCVP